MADRNGRGRDAAKAKLLTIMTSHVGRSRVIGMGELFKFIYGDEAEHRINGTRRLRRLVTELRREGVPILSVTNSEGGGYYLASAGSELDDYCRRVRKRALKLLRQESRLRKMSLPALMGQISLNLRPEGEGR